MTRFDLHMAKTPALPFADAEDGVTVHERHCHCSVTVTAAVAPR
jgi:hypothetical protein